jgi:hypothetical protein
MLNYDSQKELAEDAARLESERKWELCFSCSHQTIWILDWIVPMCCIPVALLLIVILVSIRASINGILTPVYVVFSALVVTMIG